MPERPNSPVRNRTPEEVAEAFSRARRAQDQWRRYSLSQRVEALRDFWAFLQKDRGGLASVLAEETGKPAAEIETMEIDAAGLILAYFTANAHRILQDRAVVKPWFLLNKRAYVRHAPRGVALLITPWNMPFLIPFGDAVPALLAGNAAVLKPSEWATNTALYLEERGRASGILPEGLLQVLPGDGATGAQAVEHADMIVFTGSSASGRKVAEAAARRLVPVVLELGGLHTMIVAKDAALARTAKAAVWGRFANSGQICVGVERVLAEESVYPALCELIKKETAALRPPGHESGEADYGRLIYPGQLEVVERHLADAREQGAEVVGGRVLDRERRIVEPALVFGARPGMKVYDEETFGPVLALAPVARIEDAVRQANEGGQGLAASVWTADLTRGEDLAAMLETAMVGVNDVLTHYAVAALPFGGRKLSGMGRRHSEAGLRMFAEEQSIIVHEWPAAAPDPWWFPYGRAKSRLLSACMRWSG